MIKFMRLANLLFMILLGIVALLQITANFSGYPGPLEISWFAIFVLLWVYLIPWHALSETASPRMQRFARGFMAIAMVFTLIGPLCIMFNAHVENVQDIRTTMIAAGLPVLLSYIALHQKLRGNQATNGAISAPVSATGSNYLLAHWRGQLPLGKSFWLNGVLIGNLLAALFVSVLGRLIDASDASLRTLSIVSILSLVSALLIWLWSVTGIVRSASKHKQRGGSGFTVALVQLLILLNILAVLLNTQQSYIPQLKEFALLATGHDSMKTITVVAEPGSKVLSLRGTIGEGSLSVFAAAMMQYPHVNTVALSSPGGRLREARQIAELIREKQLNTYVEGECSSACTYIFLAGKERAATPNAHIGFHQSRFPGMGNTERDIANSAMERHYRAAKLPEDFIRKVINTSAEGMWYPTREQMLSAGVITRVTLDGEGSTLLEMQSRDDVLAYLSKNRTWQSYERLSPGKINEVTDLIWNMKQEGKDLHAMQAAIKTKTAQIYLRALKSAPDELLDEYAQLLSEQLEAARHISPQACTELIRGSLNIQRTMPEDLVRRDSDLVEKVLSSEPRKTSYVMASKDFASSARKLQSQLSPLHQQVVANLEAYTDKPMFQCDAVTGMYRIILRMQDKDRHIILSAFVQAK